MPLPLLALFLAAFGIGTAEFVIAGLLPAVSTDLGVSIPTAGLLISAYAIGVAIGGPIVTLLVAKLSRKTAIVILVGAFTAGQALCALAPDYTMLLIARLLVSIGHGAYFGVAAISATRLVPPAQSGRAVAMLLAGITVANIIGVPAGTAIGNALGWRATFWAVGAFSAVALAAITLLVPADAPETHAPASLGSQFRVLGRPAIYMSFAIIVSAATGQFVLFSYIAPFLIEVTKVPVDLVPWLLLLFGVGSTAGVLIGGRLADWKLMPTLIGMLLGAAVVYALILVLSGNLIAMALLHPDLGRPQLRLRRTGAVPHSPGRRRRAKPRLAAHPHRLQHRHRARRHLRRLRPRAELGLPEPAGHRHRHRADRRPPRHRLMARRAGKSLSRVSSAPHLAGPCRSRSGRESPP